MCLPLDGNICFFLSMETQTDSEKERRSREKEGDDGRKQVVLADHSAVALVFKAWLSPHWANTVSVLSWYRLCGGEAGQDSVEFAVHAVWSESTGCNLMKNNFTLFTSLSLQSTRAKEQSTIWSYSAAKTKHYQEIKTHTYTHTTHKTKQGWERHTHFFKTQPCPFSASLIPDILYQAFYLFFIDFHNAFRWCDRYSERRLVNLQPLASISALGAYWALLFRPHVCIGPHLPALSCGYDIIERKTRAFSPKCTLTH